MPEPWRLAEPLAAAGVDREWLDRVAELAGPATDAALALARGHAHRARPRGGAAGVDAADVDLVGAVKTYAYMDRGELVEVDVHEGLETTLTVLGHKLKHTEIEVARDYDRDAAQADRARLRAQPGLDQPARQRDRRARRAAATITIATRRDGDCAEIEIADDGPGIPPRCRDRVFDSFFTTKDVGHGTGLGLATAQRIVVDRHDGTLTVESEPGRTTFRVRLPITQR